MNRKPKYVLKLTADEAPGYAQAERITLASDNLNTHRLASLYEAFAPEEAMRLARNQRLTGIDWQFPTADARNKLKYLYPKIEE
jgi:hypothetical protein